MTSQYCHRNSRSSFFPNKIISELSFTGVNLLCLGHLFVSQNSGKWQNPASRPSWHEGFRKTPKGHRQGSQIQRQLPRRLMLCTGSFPGRRWEQGSPARALPQRPSGCRLHPLVLMLKPLLPQIPQPCRAPTPEPSGASKAFLMQ